MVRYASRSGVVCCSIAVLLILAGHPTSAESDHVFSALVSHTHGAAPAVFTMNVGQWPDSILFRASDPGVTLWITTTGVHYQIAVPASRRADGLVPDLRQDRIDSGKDIKGRTAADSGGHEFRSCIISAGFAGDNDDRTVIGEGLLDYKCHYFLTDDSTRWRVNVPNFRRVVVRNVGGVDIAFDGVHGVAPVLFGESKEAGASALPLLRFRDIEEANGVSDGHLRSLLDCLDGGGRGVASDRDLSAVGAADVAECKMPNERGRVAGAPSAGKSTWLSYSTYLGGAGYDAAFAVLHDSSAGDFVSGYTLSADFPLVNEYQSDQGSADVFLSALSSDGDLLYSTYFGGSGWENCFGLKMAADGNIIVAGYSSSDNLPLVSPLYAFSGKYDGWIAEFGPDGDTLIFCTYIGGSEDDAFQDMDVDVAGNIYVAGYSRSPDYPLVAAYQGFQGALGQSDAVISIVSSDRNALLFSSYLGGDDGDVGYGISCAGDADFVVTGFTGSSTFPVVSALQPMPGGADDAFLTRFSGFGDSVVFSTYVGGGEDDYGQSVATGEDGCSWIVGYSASAELPLGTPQQPGGSYDAFLVRVSPGGALLYATFFGGSDADWAYDVATRHTDDVVVCGGTESSDFPFVGDNAYQGERDVIVRRYSVADMSLQWEYQLASSLSETGNRIAVTQDSAILIAGYTNSTTFPVVNPIQDYAGGVDAFVTRVSERVTGCCEGLRGDTDGQGDPSEATLGDLTVMIDHLFVSFEDLECWEEGNVDESQPEGPGSVSLGDLTVLIDHLFVSFADLPPCP